MLRALLAKDLRRVRRNPLPWLINLIVPLCMTALIGLAFGGKSDSGQLGRIHFAVVDEDKTRLSDLLRGSSSQGDAAKFLDPVFLDRDEALRQINDDKLAAVLIIPTNFTRHYLSGSEAVSLELIKNPAQSIHPAVMEELLGALVTGMNALSRNFHADFPELQEVIDGRQDFRKVSALINREGEKLEALKKYVNPPLVSFETEVRAGESKGGPAFNLFAYLLLGLAGMFLLFIANNAMTDLHRELRFRTFERYQTMRQQLLPFVAGKVVFTVVLLLLCSAVMLGGGGLLFRIHWLHPLALAALVFGYACFAAGLMAVLVALVPDERRANALNTITGMALGIAGGCAFPTQQLPAFLREHITPNLPSFWFADTARNLLGGTDVPWIFASIKLIVASALLIGLAAFLFHRRFKSGGARMRRILDIGHNDLRLFFKSKRSAFIWLFLVPLTFVYFMGFANRGPGDPSNRKPAVLIDNEDTNYLGRIFLDELGAQGMWLLDPTNTEPAARGIRIPVDFTDKVQRQEQSKVLFFKREGSAEADAAIIKLRLMRALIAMNGHILEAALQTNSAGTLTEARLRAVMAEPDPVSLNARFAGRKPVPSGFNFSLPGNLVMYLMMNLLIFGGTTVAAERRNGVIRRLMMHPVRRGEIVTGKIYGLMLLGVVQILFFLAVGKFAFHVNLGANLPAVTLTLLVFAWVAGSLGVLAGSVIAAEDRVVGICVLGSLLMAALGGCWWPLEVGPPILKTISLCLPSGWALAALHKVISFGAGFDAVLLPLAVLVGFGVTANFLAARFFRA